MQLKPLLRAGKRGESTMKPPDTRAGDWMRPTAEDENGYAVGWTIGGVVTLGTIIAVWMFAI